MQIRSSVERTPFMRLMIQICYNQMNQLTTRTLLFLFLAGGIYSCYITSAVFHEKLLKHAYVHKQTGEQTVFSCALIFAIFPQLIATILGKTIICCSSETVNLPWKKCLATAMILNVCGLTYNEAVIYASFPAVVMAKSCSLLSVIVVAVFCSRVKEKSLKLNSDKIFIGLLATIGIIFFNFFKKSEHSSIDNPISIFSLSSLFLLISLVGDGFLPDFQAQLKSEYKPSSIDMYYHINKFACLIGITEAIITTKIFYIADFIMNYQDFGIDLIMFASLNGIGQLFIYRMIKEFKQHIPPFVIAFRKCLTVLVNILWFKHLVNWQQMCGISLVFVAVIWEVWSNYQEKVEKEKKDEEEKKLIKPLEADETDEILKSIDEQLSNLPEK